MCVWLAAVDHMGGGIADSLCVGQKYRGDERVVLFLKMMPGYRWAHTQHSYHLHVALGISSFSMCVEIRIQRWVSLQA